MAVFAVAGSLACTGMVVTAAAADTTVALASAPVQTAGVTAPITENEIHGNLADQVKRAVYAELSEVERKSLAGSSAEIELKFSENGQFEMASVTANGINKLVTTIHRKIAWKSLPATGKQAALLTSTRMKVGIKANGEINIQFT